MKNLLLAALISAAIVVVFVPSKAESKEVTRDFDTYVVVDPGGGGGGGR